MQDKYNGMQHNYFDMQGIAIKSMLFQSKKKLINRILPKTNFQHNTTYLC